MTWHIFRKDLRLLWPLAALVAAAQLLNAGLLIGGGPFMRFELGGMSQFGWVSNIALPGVGLLGLVVLVMAVVQQDRLPGTTQDWLTRPIPRRQLLLAKLLFVALIGLLPILAADLAMGLAEHLNLADVVAGSLTRSLVLFCLVCVPAVLIGAVTRTLTEALVLVLAVAVLLIIEFIALVQIGPLLPVMQSGYGWILTPTLMLLNLGALMVLVPLQFRWRSTNRVRWILAAFFCLLPAVIFLPWDAAARMDRALEPGNFASTVGIALDPSRRITFTPMPTYPAGGKPRSVVLRVPVVVSNQGPGNQVFVDRIKLRAIDTAHRGFAGDEGEDLSHVNQFGFVLDRTLDPTKPAPEIIVTIPFDAFSAARASQSQIEIQLLATKLRLAAEKPLQSLAPGSIDDHGRCYPQTDGRFGRSTRTIYCVSARPIGNCFSIRDPSRQLRTAGINAFRCGSSTYAPWPLPLWRDAYYSVSLGAADDHLVVANYVHDAHFARTIDFQIGLAVETASRYNQTSDGVGSAARFASPTAAVADSRGNLFIVDEADSVIRKVSPAGEVSTFAGSVQQIGRGDGAAGDARFSRPHGIAIDKADNLFVADTGNGLIRKITPAGVVTTLLGITGDAGNRTQPLRFVSPRGVTCAPDGTLFIIDSNGVAGGNFVIRKVSPSGVVSTIAGPDEPVGPDNGGLVVTVPAAETLERD